MVPAERDLEAGVSLLEAVTSMALGLILLGALFQFLTDFQRTTVHLLEQIESEQRLLLLPLLLNSLLASAGNQRPSSEAVITGTAPVLLHIETDLEGNDGFPDGVIDDPFEDLFLRSRGETLQLATGQGSFQPLQDHTRLAGASTPARDLLELRLEVFGQGDRGRSDELEVSIYIWNRRPLLFPEGP